MRDAKVDVEQTGTDGNTQLDVVVVGVYLELVYYALQRLRLQDNKLTTLQDSVGQHVALQESGHENNQLSTLLKSFGQLVALRW